MVINMKKITAFSMVFIILCSVVFPAYSMKSEELGSLSSSVSGYIYDTVKNPSSGSIGGEWAIIGLARSGADIPNEYFEKYYESAERLVKNNKGILHDKKYTEYSRMVLAMTAIGKDPTNIGGYNLLMPLADYDKVVWQGVNGPIWALLALNSKDYSIPQNNAVKKQATKEMYLEYILDNQKPDGGWSMSGDSSDIDLTAMAIMALSHYKDDNTVSFAIDRGLNCLSDNQSEDGGFKNGGNENAESVAQVIIALCELGISPEDARFQKNGNSIIDNLLKYSVNGGFKHLITDLELNQMASEQGLCAVVAVERFLNGKNSLYDMTDVDNQSLDNENSAGLVNKHADVKKQPIININVAFYDILGNQTKPKIEALAKRGIINGKTDTSFDPQGTMTRAEFATIITRGLGLTKNNSSDFCDVTANDWFYSYVNTAYYYGIINGVSDTEFNPNGTITREEAAVMVMRAAKLCGLDCVYDQNSARDTLAQFYDYITVSDWATEAMAFCYDEDIFSDNTETIMPKECVKRDEIADMIYNMLNVSKLL